MVKARILLLMLFAATVGAKKYFFVIGPNVFRFNHEEDIAVSIVDANNQIVSVWLEYNGKVFSKKEVFVPAENQQIRETLKITAEDIFADKKRADSVKLVASCFGEKKESEVLINYNSGYLIAQLDKPLYTPGQTVYYRVLDLEESLKRNKDAQLAIDIIDAKNRTVRRTKPTDEKKFSDSYRIPLYADLGLWTLRAFYMGNYSTEARATFSVEEYELPTFGVTVKIKEKFIEESTTEFKVDVEARYVYGKPVDGNVGLEMFLRNDAQGLREFVMKMERGYLQNGVKTFTVNTDELLSSPLIPEDVKNSQFPPDGYSLEVVADVFELVTGNEEKGSADVIFAETPYKFKFSKSKDSYSPAYLYYLHVEVLFANGDLVPDGDVDIKMVRKSDNKEEMAVGHISNGKVVKSFQTVSVHQILEFQVTYENVESQKFSVHPYQASEQLRLEIVEHQGKTQLRIDGGAEGGPKYSDLTVMIIARGGIELIQHKDLSREVSENLEDDLLERMAPVARAVVFYVIKATGEVVTDSVRIDVPPKCRRGGLKLDRKKGEVYAPGRTADLLLTGEPFMHVGLNAMDSALLLLNKDNILKKNTMFRLLEAHDLGCGAGGGFSSAEVFKRAGVTVLTNANVNNIKRDSLTCNGHARRKRAIACYAHDNCCLEGMNYAQEILEEKQILEEMDPTIHVDVISRCYGKTKELLKNKDLPAKCIQAFLKFCLHEILQYDEVGSIEGKSFDDESDYERDIKQWNRGEDITVRQNFKESWLFEEVTLDQDGAAKKSMNFPSSITTWHIQAIGFSETSGLCIAEPLDIVSSRDFFIQLDLPYSAVRFENVNVKMTVFNYYKESVKVHAYIEGQEGLCSSAKVGQQSSKQVDTIMGNNATSFNFLVLPLKAGKHDIKVTALGRPGDGETQTDAVLKKLLVLNEGKPKSKTVTVCLDPVDEMRECEDSEEVKEVIQVGKEKSKKVELIVPKNATAGTGQAIGYIKSNLMTDIVKYSLEGTEDMIKMPYGCGEQTMIFLAPTVYAMFYLKQTKQMSDALEESGNKFIRQGVERELSFRHDDFSYAAWKSRTSSTWLTAFVMKVFCQAKKAVDNSVNVNLHITPTLEYLLSKHNNGKFYDPLPVIHREMIGQIKEEDPTLTAFVVISFMECDSRTAEMNETMLKAVKYLEEDVSRLDYENNPYLLSITTYALGMANSEKKWDFMNMLQSKAKKDGKKMYWGNHGKGIASADAVETTSYALLAYLNFNYVEESAYIVRWLVQQRQGRGTFRTTQDTVVGLQALSEYNIRTYTKDVNLQVTFLGPTIKTKTVNISSENAQVMKVVEGLHSGDGKTELTVKVVGSGKAVLSIDFEYNELAKDEPCPFNVTEIITEDIEEGSELDQVIAENRNCDVCGKCEGEDDGENKDYAIENFAGQEVQPKLGSKILDRRRRQAQDGSSKMYCVRFEVSSDSESDMAIVSFGLQTGVNVIKADLEQLLKDQPSIARYETPSEGKGYVTFYLDKLQSDPVKFIFKLKDDFAGDGNTRQMAKMDIYEYYNPDRTCTKFYGVDAQGNEPLSYECAADSKNCKCLQHLCAKNFEKKFMNKKKTKLVGRPALHLIKRLCVLGKADYAVVVTVVSVVNDPDAQYIKAMGEVQKVIKRGIEDLRPGSEMSFRYRTFCTEIDLVEGQKYYIIAKNGFDIGNKTYQYELMDTAVVLKKPKRGPLKKAMANFERLIKPGCMN